MDIIFKHIKPTPSEIMVWKNWTNSQKSDLIHDFTMRNYDRASKKIDYGMGVVCTPVEAHLLEKIYLNVDITVTELAEKTNRSKAAISQIVKKLEHKGLVNKTPMKSHAKKLALSLSNLGNELTEKHISYDEKVAGAFFEKLSEDFSDEDMTIFFNVLHRFLENMHSSRGYDE